MPDWTRELHARLAEARVEGDNPGRKREFTDNDRIGMDGVSRLRNAPRENGQEEGSGGGGQGWAHGTIR